MSTILHLKNVTKKFGGLTAVNNLTIDVKENQVHALIGPNGAGKTTVTNLIFGVLKADEGEIVFNDEKINSFPTYQIARKGIGRTFQNIKLFGSMTAAENIMIGGHSNTKLGMLHSLYNPFASAKEEKILREKAEEVLEFLGMYNLKDEMVKNLPYGRQKVLELGRTMMTNPKLILLDEPAAGLNPSERLEFVSIMAKLYKQGKTLFLIEHNMDVVMTMSHNITVLNFGAKIAEGTPKEIQNNDEVIMAYLGNRYKKEQANQGNSEVSDDAGN